MAINERVGILTHFGPRVETPGLIDGIYAEFLTKEFDFLDDVRNWPQSSDFVSDPMVYIGTNTWEDLGNYFRPWRDGRANLIMNYWNTRASRSKFEYQNVVLDPNPFSNNGNGSNEFEKLRFVFPSKDGEINYPYPDTLIGSDHYAFYNRRRPLMVDKVRMGMKSIDDLGKLLTFQNPEILQSIDSDSYQTLIEYFDDKNTVVYLLKESGNRDLSEEEQSLLNTLRAKCLAIDFDTVLCNPATDERILNTSAANSYLVSQFPGITEINVLPSVGSFNMLTASASVGDIAFVESNGWYAWDAINNEWNQSIYDYKIDDYLSTFRSVNNDKMQRRNEVGLSMRPFIFASLYIPAFQILSNVVGGIIKNFSKPISMDI